MSIGIGFFTVMSFVSGIFLYNKGKSDARTENDSGKLSELGTGLSDTTDKLSKNTARLSDLIEDIEKTRHGTDD